MLIHVEDAPDLVIGQELIPPALRVALSLPLPRCRSLDQGLRNATLVIDLDGDQGIAEGCPKIFEVASLRDAAFADDQDASFRLLSGATAPEIFGTSPVPSTHLHRSRSVQ
ncbi:MAG TPA: hypothetical protein VLX28_22260 [Thermoanaerobaculia bacterium]|nr:hypothetical protein [Thermoanaerobaculia bacterium]